MSERARRNIEMFGTKGQDRIELSRVGVVGYGGLGSHCGQQLAHLGTIDFTVVDPDTVEESNLNRLVGAVPADAANQAPKVDIAERTIKAINPQARVVSLPVNIADPRARAALEHVDVVFGAVDNDVARLSLTEFCSEQGIIHIDMATDAGEYEDGRVWFGGRVVICDGNGCLSCLDLLDQRELARAAMTQEQRDSDDRIYGVDRAVLDAAGPMVVSVNGVVASLAVTEFIALVTNLRSRFRYVTYRGDVGIVAKNTDPPNPDCYYCAQWNRTKGK